MEGKSRKRVLTATVIGLAVALIELPRTVYSTIIDNEFLGSTTSLELARYLNNCKVFLLYRPSFSRYIGLKLCS